MSAAPLSEAQARVLASLVEKSITTPQYYPLTQNSLAAACNQKSARYPVMSLSEHDVGEALISLEGRNFVKRDDRSGRVIKWRHQFQHELLLKAPVMAVLTALMLRGPQTLAELRSHAAPLGGPEDIEGVKAALADLEDRAEPLARALPRQAGQSSQRYLHTLSPAPELPVQTEAAGSNPRAALEARIEALEARVETLEARLAAQEPGA